MKHSTVTTIRNTVLLFVFALSIVPAQAQTPMTLSQAVETGLQKSKALRIAKQKVTASEAGFMAADANRFGWLKFSGSYTRLSKVDPFSFNMMGTEINISPSILDNYSTKLTFAQPLFLGNKISASVDIAELSYLASKQDLQKDASELVVAITTSYWNLYKAMQMKNVLDETVAQISAHVEDAKNLYAAGLLTNNDVLKLQVQLADIKYRQADAANGVQLANLALNNTLGIGLTETIIPSSTANAAIPVYDNLNELLSSANNNRPELKSAALRMQSGEAGITIAKSSWYPQVNLVGNYNYARPNQRIFPTKDEFKGTWDVSVAVSFDIWDWNARSHQTEQAEAQLAQAKDALDMTKDGITLEVTQSYLNVKLAKEKLQIAQQAQQQAAENFRITGEKFKQGTALSSDLIDAEVAFVQAKTNYTTAVVDLEIAVAKLKKSIGEKGF